MTWRIVIEEIGPAWRADVRQAGVARGVVNGLRPDGYVVTGGSFDGVLDQVRLLVGATGVPVTLTPAALDEGPPLFTPRAKAEEFINPAGTAG